ncbi:MAG: amidohydrolase family protein [Pirellulales bacterium]|nr:amidohydrolase family protein [Pirellulales bacterium]
MQNSITCTLLLAVALCLGGLSAAVCANDPYDLLLTNGHIIDGSGNPWYAGDVAIRAGRIAAIGQIDEASAQRVIDVSGKVIAPGFIDIHSHAEDGLVHDDAERRAAPNLVSQGITTVVVNQDGYGPASLAEQMAQFRSKDFGPNVALMIGHGGVRRNALRNDFQRPATDNEIKHMVALVAEALDRGAFGFSAGLEYSPGRWSRTNEIIAIVGEVAKHDGVYILHERASGADPMWYIPSRHEPGPPSMLDNIRELIEVGKVTGGRVVATHIKARGTDFWGSAGKIIEMINAARAEGVRIYADQYPYNTSGTDGSIVLIPSWAMQARVDDRQQDVGGQETRRQRRNRRGPAAALETHLKDEQTVSKLRMDIEHAIRRRGGAENIIIMEHPREELVGKSIADLARLLEKSQFEAVLALQLEGNRSRRGGARLRSYSMSEEDVEAFAAQPWCATCTDGGIAVPTDRGSVHPRYYGTFPRKIRHYAMTRGVLSVEDAVRSSTSLPVQIMGMRERGLIREGMHADIVVFDPEEIRDVATAFEPHQYSSGIEHVLIAGQFVVESSELTGAMPGRLLLREDSKAAGDEER